MKRFRNALAVGAIVGLAGCVVAHPTHYAVDHPANPSAPAAAMDGAPDALSSYRTFDGAAAKSEGEDGHAHRH